MNVVWTKWDRRRDRRFWALLALLVVLHLVVLYRVRFAEPAFGMAVAPFVFLDYFVMLGLVRWVERRFWTDGSGRANPSASLREAARKA